MVNELIKSGFNAAVIDGNHYAKTIADNRGEKYTLFYDDCSGMFSSVFRKKERQFEVIISNYHCDDNPFKAQNFFEECWRNLKCDYWFLFTEKETERWKQRDLEDQITEEKLNAQK